MTITCWSGPPSAFELRLASPISVVPIEQLRLRLTHAVTTTHDGTQGARAILQMAFDTEVGVPLVKLLQAPPDLQITVVCPRRRFLDVDADMRTYSFLVEPALQAMSSGIPISYVNLLRRHLAANYARYRVCAIAATVCAAIAVAS